MAWGKMLFLLGTSVHNLLSPMIRISGYLGMWYLGPEDLSKAPP